MKPLRRAEPSDTGALQMENEVLAHEITFLRARVAEAEAAARAANPDKGMAVRDVPPSTEDDEEFERYRRAYYDLRWLLGRFESSPVRGVLRRFEGYRVLAERYAEQ